jgi:hypothetical protein
MPVDYRLFVKANVLNLARFGFELNTILYEYTINENIDDDIFDRAIITVLPNADEKNSEYWEEMQSIPNTIEEIAAYERIDSISLIPRNFWDDFSPLSTRLYFNENISTSAPLAMYHFNRAEGHALDFGIFLEDAYNKRLNSSLNLSYGFADKKFKQNIEVSYLFGDYRTFRIAGSAYNTITPLFDNSDNYNELTSTLLSLISKYEFRDYYYSKGGEISFAGDISSVLRLNVGFKNQTDNSAIVNTQFSIINRDKLFKENPQIFETKVNAVTAGFFIDYRKYIEDGFYRLRVSSGESFFTFKGDVIYSSGDLLNSQIDFTTYKLRINGLINTFGQSTLNIRIFGMYNDGRLPYQLMHSLPGNIDVVSKSYSFRTLDVNEIFGEKVLAFNTEQNWGNELFRWLGVPGLKDWDIHLNTFFNAGYTSIGGESNTILQVQLKTIEKPFYEAGFGIGHVLIPLRLEFAWKLNQRGDNNFRVSLNSFAF